MVLHHCFLHESTTGEEDVLFAELSSRGEYGSTEMEEPSNLEPILERSEVMVGMDATCWTSRMEGSLTSDKEEWTPSTAKPLEKTGMFHILPYCLLNTHDIIKSNRK